MDAVVNAANAPLLGGGGIDGAIRRKGGPAILEACRRLRTERHPDGLPTGQAAATPAGRLPTRWVIHTVGPVYSAREDRSALPRELPRLALRVADALGCGSVAFPAISTGIYGSPLDLAAPVAVGAVRTAATRVAEVRSVLFYSATHAAFERALGGPRPWPAA